MRKERNIEDQLQGQRRVVIKYTTDNGVTYFTCTLQVTPNATFQVIGLYDILYYNGSYDMLYMVY